MKVLIIKMSALGDIIHALPVLDYLHHVSPGITVDWVVEAPFREVLDGNPLINQLHLVRTKLWRKNPLSSETWADIAAVKKQLREREYDIVFDIQGNLKSGLICWLSGSKNIFGFSKNELQETVNQLFTTRQVPIHPQDLHITDQYLRLVSTPFDKNFEELDLASDIFTLPEDDRAAQARLAPLSNGPKILFHQGTTWETKYWTDERWIQLGKALLNRFNDASILLSWGNDTEHSTATAIAAAIGPSAVVLDRYSLKGFAALLKRVDVVIGGDTGPVHIAAAVGTPTVSLYRASNGRRSGPRGKHHVVIQAPMECTACFRTKCSRDRECRESITAAAVLDGVETILNCSNQ